MKREVPVFTDYNMIKKLMFMPAFIFLCGAPIILIMSSEDIKERCFFLLIQIISLLLTIIRYTDHVSVYSDRIETGSIFSKKTTLFKEIKKMDIRLVQESHSGWEYNVLYALFFSKHGQELLTLRIKSILSSSTNRIDDIISVIKNYNNKIELSKDFIKYLNENTNYKKNNKL